jgi:hypothetical protein
MSFAIRMGMPEMDYYWQDMTGREAKGELDKGELKTFRKLIKSFNHLSINPRYPGLCSHEIEPLSRIAGLKIWESYIENNTPAAGRIFWVYGPGKNEISILGFEPHPEDKKKTGYAKVKLSDLPPL